MAVLLADLPAVRVEEIRLALHAAARTTRAVVPDAAGVGSVLITALGGATLEPRFGPDSAARHVEAGHHRIGLDLVGLRADVDDAASLRAAIDVGVGRHTAAVLAGQPALG